MSTVLEKRDCYLKQFVRENKSLIKTWFLNVGYDFINSKKFSQPEEDMLEKIADFYLESLAKI